MTTKDKAWLPFENLRRALLPIQTGVLAFISWTISWLATAWNLSRNLEFWSTQMQVHHLMFSTSARHSCADHFHKSLACSERLQNRVSKLTWKKSILSLTTGPYLSAQTAASRWGSFTRRAEMSPKMEYVGPGRWLSALDLSRKTRRILRKSTTDSSQQYRSPLPAARYTAC